MAHIDLNCDMGELPEAIVDGTQESIMPWVSSVNIACGGHAGDRQTMRATIEQAQRWRLAIGAHPGYPDRQNFGRVAMSMTSREISDCIYEQVRTFGKVAQECGVRVGHVKAHGALYNQAANNKELAAAIAFGVARWNPEALLVGLAGSAMLEVFRQAGFTAIAEAFADRRYDPNGELRSREYHDALIEDPDEAGRQAVEIATASRLRPQNGELTPVIAQTLCIHGDTPGAARVAAGVHRALAKAGIEIANFWYPHP